jgi:hypothetical protein
VLATCQAAPSGKRVQDVVWKGALLGLEVASFHVVEVRRTSVRRWPRATAEFTWSRVPCYPCSVSTKKPATGVKNGSMSGRPLEEMRRHNPAEQSEINPPPAILNYRLAPHTPTYKVGRHRGVKIERKNLGPVDGIPPTLYLGERVENL